MLEEIVKIGNDGLSGIWEWTDNPTSRIHTDQRWISVQSNETYIDVRSPGRVCYDNWDEKQYCQGWDNMDYVGPTSVQTNNNMMYKLSTAPFQSILSLILNHRNVSFPFNVTSMKVITFVNTGLLIQVNAT